MFVEFGGRYFYLDEESFAERITKAEAATDKEHPWRIEEIVAIQQRMKSLDDLLLEHMRATATPDPIERLREHIAQMCSGETSQETPPVEQEKR